MATTGSGWLPPEPAVPSLEGMRWWKPAGVAEQLVSDGRWNLLSYIVLDELHEGVAGLVVGRWPRIDDRGRLRFGEEDEFTRIATSARALHALLEDQRLPIVSVDIDAAAEGELRARDLAIGDVFGARSGRPPGEPGGGGPGGEPLEDPRSVLGDRIVDITAEARQAAKLQATAAASGVMDEALVIAIADEIAEDEAPPETEPDPETSPPQSSGGSPATAAPPPEPSDVSAVAEAEAELDAATHEVDAEAALDAATIASEAEQAELERLRRQLLPEHGSSSEERQDRPEPEAFA